MAFSATLLCENLIFYFIILLQRGKVIELRYLGLKETQTSKKITQVYLKKKNIKLSYTTQNKKNSFKKVCGILIVQQDEFG